MAAVKGIPVVVDPKPQNMAWYRGVTLVTPNHMEATQAVNGKVGAALDIRQSGGSC